MTKKNEHYMTNENLNNCEKGTLGLRVLKHLIAIHRETAQEERMSYEEQGGERNRWKDKDTTDAGMKGTI